MKNKVIIECMWFMPQTNLLRKKITELGIKVHFKKLSAHFSDAHVSIDDFNLLNIACANELVFLKKKGKDNEYIMIDFEHYTNNYEHFNSRNYHVI